MSGRNIFENTNESDVNCKHEIEDGVILSQRREDKDLKTWFTIQGTCGKCQQYMSVTFPSTQLN